MFSNGNRNKLIELIGAFILEIIIISFLTFHHWDSNDNIIIDFLITLATGVFTIFSGNKLKELYDHHKTKKK